MGLTPHKDFFAFRNGDGLVVSTQTKFYRPHDFFAWNIQRVTKREWNHAAMLWWNSAKDEWYVIEALFKGGVTVRPLSVYLTPRFHLVVGHITPEQDVQQAACSFALQQIGEPYERKLLLAIRGLQLLPCVGPSLVRFVNMEGRKIDNNLWICSELIIGAYRFVQCPLVIDNKRVGAFAGPAAVADGMNIYRRRNGEGWQFVLSRRAT